MKWIIYRLVMRIAHRFHWHYAPPTYPEGDTVLWCQWCGFRAVVKRAGVAPIRARIAESKETGKQGSGK